MLIKLEVLLSSSDGSNRLVLRKGLTVDRDNSDIKKELEFMGVRRPPVFPFLDRRHPINKVAGKVLFRLGLR